MPKAGAGTKPTLLIQARFIMWHPWQNSPLFFVAFLTPGTDLLCANTQVFSSSYRPSMIPLPRRAQSNPNFHPLCMCNACKCRLVKKTHACKDDVL